MIIKKFLYTIVVLLLNSPILLPAQDNSADSTKQKKEEKINLSLKHLLDTLRLRALLRYHLAEAYKKETKRILAEIDFSGQPFSWNLKYHIPLPVLKIWYSLKKPGSALKKRLLQYKII